MIKDIKSHYRDMDKKLSRKLREMERAGHTVACRTCTQPACCNQLISTFPEEVAVIAAELTTKLDGKGKHELSKDLLSWLNWYRGLTPEQQYSDTPYALQHRPCPLLKDGKCSVYEVRPMGCRGHYAMDQEPERCADLGTKDTLFDPNSFLFPVLKKIIRQEVIAPMPMLLCFMLRLGDVTEAELTLAYHSILGGWKGPMPRVG